MAAAHMLKFFFKDVITMAFRTPLKPGWQGVVDGLVEQVTLYPLQFIDKILYTEPNYSNEFRLNNAGLKMYWRVRKNGRLIINIGGDQENEYPEFVEKFRELVKRYGFFERD